MNNYDTMRKCSICLLWYKGYGNNAAPITKGVCCDLCNIKVLRARLKMIDF